jgi:hypothetical protein
MKDKLFTDEDMALIDALGSEAHMLNVYCIVTLYRKYTRALTFESLCQLLATGKLGRTDGWTSKDVTGPDFDPTTIRLPLVGW